MHPAPTVIYGRTLPLIGAGWLLVFFLTCTIHPNSGPEPLWISLVLGTLFQQSVLAATWCVLGPGRLLIRAPLSFGWACAMGLAMTFGITLSSPFDPSARISFILAAAIWITAQGPLWCAALFFRLRLWHQGTPPDGDLARHSQFGIRELMIFTALVAVLLGAGRLLLTSEWFQNTGHHQEWYFFSFLVITQLVMGLPLTFSLLLPRHVAIGVVCSLALIGVVTAAEAPLARQIMGPGGPSGLHWLFIYLNACSTLWAFAFAAVVRWSGYHLGVPVFSLPMQPKWIEPASPFIPSDAPAPHAPPVQSADSAAAQ